MPTENSSQSAYSSPTFPTSPTSPTSPTYSPPFPPTTRRRPSRPHPGDPFARPWRSESEERRALQEFANEKLYIVEGSNGTLPRMDAGGRGMQAMVWGGPVPDTRTGRMLGGMGAGTRASVGHERRRTSERIGDAGLGWGVRRRWSGDTLTQEKELERNADGGGRGAEDGDGGEERRRLERALSDGAGLTGSNGSLGAGESKFKSGLRRLSFLRRRKTSTVEQDIYGR